MIPEGMESDPLAWGKRIRACRSSAITQPPAVAGIPPASQVRDRQQNFRDELFNRVCAMSRPRGCLERRGGGLACRSIWRHILMPQGCRDEAGRLHVGSTGPGCRGCRCLHWQHSPGHCQWWCGPARSVEHTGSLQGRRRLRQAPPACKGSLDLGHLDGKPLMLAPAQHNRHHADAPSPSLVIFPSHSQ